MALTPARFFALTSGQPAGCAHPLSVHDLGDLHVPNGHVEASDPFVTLGTAGTVTVPAGTYPVRLTVADVSPERDGSHLREAYLSLVIADGDVSEVRPALFADAEPLADGEYYGVGVDAGTVAFTDATAARTLMPAGDDWYDELYDTGDETGWFARMDDPEHLRDGAANIVLPLATAGENIVLAHSGWGDGFYPVLTTHDASGALLGLHIDLQVAVEDDADSDDADADGADADGADAGGAAA